MKRLLLFIFAMFSLRGLGGLLLLLCLTASYAHAQDEIDLQPTLLWEEKTHTSSVNSIAFSPDGRYLASGSLDKTIKIWEAETGKEIRTLEGHTSSVYSVVFSPDGRYLASASNSLDNPIKIWEANTGKEIRTLEENTPTWCVAFSADGRYLVSGNHGGDIRIWEVNTGKKIQLLDKHTDNIQSVSFSPDGRYLVSGSWDKTIKTWEVNTGKEMQTMKGHTHYVTSVIFSPDGRYLASGSLDKTLKLWDTDTGKLLFDLKEDELIRGVGFALNGEYFFSDRGNVYNTQTGKKVANLPSGMRCSLSVDGKYYATFYDEIKIYKLYHAQTHYKKEIAQEKEKSKLFLPKDEFETQAEYAERQKKAKQFTKELAEKYEKKYEAELEQKRLKREQEVLASYQNKCLGIDKLSTYNAENQTFDITAVGKTQTVSVPRDEARSLKENLSQAKVCGVERLQFYGTGTEVVNMYVLHPVSGKRYPFGEQINLPTEASLPAVSKTEEQTYAPKKRKPTKTTTEWIEEAERKKRENNNLPDSQDKNPPVITFENLPTNSPSKAFALNGWAKDASGIKSIQINNEEIPFFPNGRFEKEIQLKQGQNSILVQASDLVGNTSKKTVNLAYQFTGKFPMPKRLALVVGNGKYKHTSELNKTHADAEAVGEALRKLGFEVMFAYDLGKIDMDKKIYDFTEKLKNERYEVGLFFYAGHGAQVEIKETKKIANFLLPIDAEIRNAAKECVDAQFVLNDMDNNFTKVKIVMLDACRDNPYEKARGRNISINGLSAVEGMLISYATEAGGQSWENSEDKNSRYTTALLKYLSEANQSLGQIMQNITKEVSEQTDKTQVPGFYNKLTSDFYFLIEE